MNQPKLLFVFTPNPNPNFSTTPPNLTGSITEQAKGEFTLEGCEIQWAIDEVRELGPPEDRGVRDRESREVRELGFGGGCVCERSKEQRELGFER